MDKVHIIDTPFKGIDLTEISEEYGTPIYVYDMRFVLNRIRSLKDYLGDEFELYYAVKANPNKDILTVLSQEADGVDISSGGELQQSLEGGFKPEHMSFAGPGKSINELEEAVKRNIGSISIESLQELKRIQSLAEEMKVQANVSLRINPAQVFKEFAIKMGGRSSQFGIDEEKCEEFFTLLERSSNCNFIGYHVYSGTQCLISEALLDNFKNTMDIVRRFTQKFNAVPRQINFGGGFGVPYYKKQSHLAAEEVCRSLSTLFSDFKKDLDLPRLIGVLELGRYIIAEAGYYITQVVDKKISRKKVYCVLNGGMNHHLAASGNFGQVIRKNFRIINISNPNDKKFETVTLVGPLCTTIDVMGDKVEIPRVNIGDYLGFLNSGAYAFTASPLLFLSHPQPGEIMVDDSNQVKKIPSVGDR
ncbi:MAG: type III PLP-dependent enzyme [bacterium]